MIVLFNTEYFDNKKFDDDCIVRRSRIHTQHIDKRTPTWAQTKLVSNVVQDAISYVDLGFAKEREFFSYEMKQLEVSYADNITARYKIAGFTVFRDLNLRIINRTTYDFLNFLGDVGGLDGVLLLFGFIIMQKF